MGTVCLEAQTKVSARQPNLLTESEQHSKARNHHLNIDNVAVPVHLLGKYQYIDVGLSHDASRGLTHHARLRIVSDSPQTHSPECRHFTRQGSSCWRRLEEDRRRRPPAHQFIVPVYSTTTKLCCVGLARFVIVVFDTHRSGVGTPSV